MPFLHEGKEGQVERSLHDYRINGMGWDHVSVSFAMRCPTWEEMCEIKDIFFREDEACVQYHPAADEYINNHPYCLHIFRPQEKTLPTPPSWMVGIRRGQTAEQFKAEIEAAYAEREQKDEQQEGEAR